MTLAGQIGRRFKTAVVFTAYRLRGFGPDVAYGYLPYGAQKTAFTLGFRLIVTSLFLSGCESIALTLFGIGAGVTTGTSVSYTIDGYAYRIFTAPLSEVEDATRAALNRMGI